MLISHSIFIFQNERFVMPIEWRRKRSGERRQWVTLPLHSTGTTLLMLQMGLYNTYRLRQCHNVHSLIEWIECLVWLISELVSVSSVSVTRSSHVPQLNPLRSSFLFCFLFQVLPHPSIIIITIALCCPTHKTMWNDLNVSKLHPMLELKKMRWDTPAHTSGCLPPIVQLHIVSISFCQAIESIQVLRCREIVQTHHNRWAIIWVVWRWPLFAVRCSIERSSPRHGVSSIRSIRSNGTSNIRCSVTLFLVKVVHLVFPHFSFHQLRLTFLLRSPGTNRQIKLWKFWRKMIVY